MTRTISEFSQSFADYSSCHGQTGPHHMRGGVVWLGVIPRPGRLAFLRFMSQCPPWFLSGLSEKRTSVGASVSVLWFSQAGMANLSGTLAAFRPGAPSHLRCVCRSDEKNL